MNAPGACRLHADSPREAFERLSTLMGSDMGVAPRDVARMIAAGVTSIARVNKKLHGGEAWFVPLWRMDELSSEEKPCWVFQETTG